MKKTNNKSISEILIKESELLRMEIIERIKIAFSHIGYVGAVVAFAFPAASSLAIFEKSVSITWCNYTGLGLNA